MANWKWCAALLAACGGLAGLAARPEGEMVRRLNAEMPTIVQRAIENYRVLDAAATPVMRDAGGRRFAPHGYNRATKKLDMRPISWWTSGYFPGALQLLGQWTDDTRVKYRDFAVKQLLALASPDYFAPSGELGGFLLRHGVGHKPGGWKSTRRLTTATTISLKRFTVSPFRSSGRFGQERTGRETNVRNSELTAGKNSYTIYPEARNGARENLAKKRRSLLW